MPFAKTVATVLSATAIAVVLAVPATAAGAGIGDPEATVSAPAGGADRLSREAMRSALPGDGKWLGGRDTGTGASASVLGGRAGPFLVRGERRRPLSAHGRIFYTREGDPQLFSCSGTVVRSAGANMVFTAAHCLFDHPAREFHTNVLFVPAYHDGEAPFGQFTARELYAPRGWVFGGDTNYDIGVLTLDEEVQEQAGARPASFGHPVRRIGNMSLFGYPAEPGNRYDGERPIGCNSSLRRVIPGNGAALLVAGPCDMQRGASGGGWVTRTGFLVSVVSHGYCMSDPRLCNLLWGPYFGTAALRLYREAGTTEPIRMGFRRVPARSAASRRPAFRVAVDASTPVQLECRVDRGPLRPCSRAFRLSRLDPGRHVLRVRATDQVGRRALIGYAFYVTRS